MLDPASKYVTILTNLKWVLNAFIEKILCYNSFMTNKTKTWLELATNDLALAQELLDRKKNVYYAAHYCHQAVEKLLKAIISQRTARIPFPTHNFKILLDQAQKKCFNG